MPMLDGLGGEAPPVASLGRPLSEAFLNVFLDRFGAIMPGEVDIELLTPGIKHVKGPALATVMASQEPPLEEDQLEPWVDELVGSLCNEGRLNGATAFKSIEALIAQIRVNEFRDRGRTVSELYMHLVSPRDTHYDRGLVLEGEAKVIRNALGVRVKQRGGRRARAERTRVNMGEISSPGSVTKDHLRQLEMAIGGKATLEHIGVVWTPEPTALVRD